MIFHRETALPSIHPLRLLAGFSLHKAVSRAASAALVFGLSCALILTAMPAQAVSLIRDPDIEYALDQIAGPVLKAAGLGNSIRVLVVNDSSLNAFVVDSQHIFIHSGMLMRMASAEMLQAVIAHEAAHITNGHLARRQANLGNSRTIAGLGMALAAAVGAATGNASAAAGLALGTQSAAQRSFLAHTRAEEASADQSGVRFMASAHIDLNGAVAVHELFRGQEVLNAARQDPYTRSHPLSRDRIRALQGFVAAYNDRARPQPKIDYWFARAKGKTSAFMRAPKWTMRRAKDSPNRDIMLMRQAIAYHKMSDRKKAVSTLNQAIALRPKDAFFYELKGQILLESRQFSAAVKAYGTAVKLAPKNALTLGGYGRALLAAGKPKSALTQLEKARARDFRDARILRDLGAAYARTGQNGMASLATAERYALQGRLKDAAIHAKRAAGLLPRGSGPWRRAQDVMTAAKRAVQ